ncbi:hypothetical protein IEQ34_021688 [Dendrobium chrysotoxum]|uniref:Uncharacterized protein n=1 Tax=Dendrobium chrysotoxum TaxID=161865 RepID=A0AAV7G475_DENCH|nr:hypothetical protein IEQ34_021688 [Dendrobium chrysotoxum]
MWWSDETSVVVEEESAANDWPANQALLAWKSAADWVSSYDESKVPEEDKDEELKTERYPTQSLFAFVLGLESGFVEDRDHIYDVEVRALELECMEEGFIRDFLKGICLVQRKTGAEIERLTPSQASSYSSLDFDGDEIESEL